MMMMYSKKLPLKKEEQNFSAHQRIFGVEISEKLVLTTRYSIKSESFKNKRLF